MKSKNIILLTSLSIFGICQFSGSLYAQGAFRLGFHGFVSFEMFYDTRQTESGREGNVLLFPSAKALDPDGIDLNEVPSFQISLLSSRLQATVGGPKILGAESSALFEVDFLGTGPSMFNHIRMRHAMIKLDWQKTSLLAGQYWHPLFVTSCYPGVIHFGGGAPYNALNRSPQLRLTYKSGSFSFMIALLGQTDFSSTGPQGKSSIYLRNSGIPETWGQIIFSKVGFLAGASAGLLSLKPKTQTSLGYKTAEKINTLGVNLFFKLRFDRIDIKAQGTYGENLNHLVMLGGYGEAGLIDPVRGIYNYSGMRSITSWIDIGENSGSWRAGFFLGLSKNLGFAHEINGAYWVRGADVSLIYRLAPRLSYFTGNTSFNLELVYDTAAYGVPDKKFHFEKTTNISNLRTLATIKYNF